jgi:putative ABC transport system permease protein
MYFLKRARLYVSRKWGKTITVGVILFIVSTLVLTGLLIKTASQSTFEMARNKLGATVTYTSDLSSVMGNNGGRPTTRGSGFSFTMPEDYTAITTKEVELIASNSKYVKNYTISANLAANAVDFSYYNPSSTSEEEDDSTSGFRAIIKNNANVNIVGVDTKSKESNFNSDDNTIVDGRYFTDEEVESASKVIMIEKTIADLNSIKVGDSITIERVNRRMLTAPSGENSSANDGNNTVDITYQVVGIYKTSNPTDLSNSDFMASFNLTENTMYAPYTTVLSSNLEGLSETDLETAKANIKENGYEVQNVTFNLKSPEDIDAFIAEVKAMDGINTTYRSLNANDAAYEQMVGPIENVANTSTVLVVVVIIAGAFIIGLLSMLSIKDRKYELGVLLSLGESRFKIVCQLISEMLIVSILSFVLATVVSNFTAQATTNLLLNQEIASESDNSNNNSTDRGQFGGFGMIRIDKNQLSKVDVETIDTLTVSVNSNDILKMFGLGILIIVIGNIIQAMFVLRCNPKQILLER